MGGAWVLGALLWRCFVQVSWCMRDLGNCKGYPSEHQWCPQLAMIFFCTVVTTYLLTVYWASMMQVEKLFDIYE